MVAANGSVHKIEASWDQFASGDFPAVSPARQLFQDTVLAVAASAKAAMPHAAPRIDRARDLVLGNLVERQHDGSFAVRSASAKGKTYVVSRDGGCECLDVEKLPDRRCKHL